MADTARSFASAALGRALRLIARAQLALAELAVRGLARHVNHDDARIRMAAKAARWYVKRGRRVLAGR